MSTDDSNDEESGELPVSGSFFNQVPPPAEPTTESDNNDDNNNLIEDISASSISGQTADMDMFQQIIQKTTLR